MPAPYLDRIAYSKGVWGSAPLQELVFDPYVGHLLDENWQSFDSEASVGDWVVTQATAGTAAKSAAETGVLLLDSDSTTAAQGVQIQQAKAAFVPVAGRKTFAEFQVKVVDTFDKAQLFIGLSEIDTTVLASGALSTSNHIGWKCLTGAAGVLTFDSEKATAVGTASATTLVEDTYVRLGFVIDGVTSVQQYVNGVATGSPIATANIPVVALYPTLVCLSDGTNDPILHARPFRIFQTYN